MAICGCTECGAVDDIEFGEDQVMNRRPAVCKCGGLMLPAKVEFVYRKLLYLTKRNEDLAFELVIAQGNADNYANDLEHYKELSDRKSRELELRDRKAAHGCTDFSCSICEA